MFVSECKINEHNASVRMITNTTQLPKKMEDVSLAVSVSMKQKFIFETKQLPERWISVDGEKKRWMVPYCFYGGLRNFEILMWEKNCLLISSKKKRLFC